MYQYPLASLVFLLEDLYTTSALLSLTNGVFEALDSMKEVVTIFFDLSKAFDSVSHAQLL